MQLQEVMDLARDYADMVNSNFISDSELTQYINDSYSALYDLLVQTDQDYYTISSNFIVNSGESAVDLPEDFYKLRGLDINIGSMWYVLHKFNFQQRDRYNLIPYVPYGPVAVRYRVVKNSLMLIPDGNCAGTFRLWYVPQCPVLVNPTDELDSVEAWEEYVAVDAAIKMLVKEESDASKLELRKQQLNQRILEMADNRDYNEPETVTDVSSRGKCYYGAPF